MDATNLKQQLMQKELSPLYIFTGDETAVRDTYVKKIISISGLTSVRASSVLEVFSAVKNKSLFGSGSCVYIISNDKDFLINYEHYNALNAVLKDNVLILLYDNIDMRSKFYKTHADTIVKFEHMSRDILIKYIQKDVTLTHRYADMLAEVCDDDYSRILLEIDKIQHYANSQNISADEAFIYLVRHNIIYNSPYDALFDFSNSVLLHDVKKSYELLQECIDNNEPSLVLLSVLYNEFKQTLQVQSFAGTDIVRVTGLTKWQINKATTHKNKYRTGELVRAMKLISKVVAGIKIGKIDDSIAVDYVLANIF